MPVSIEMDLTSRCNKSCHNCPSSNSECHWNLDLADIENFFREMSGYAKGLLLSGGEPTISPVFAETLALARENHFEEVSVVTNGTNLDDEIVSHTLVHNASVVRISIYGWDNGPDEELARIFASTQKLRERVDRAGSELEIGFSFLTDVSKLDQLAGVAEAVRSHGGHWLYFHPRCEGWEIGDLQQFDQSGVKETVEVVSRQYSDFNVLYFPARYDRTPLTFDQYHAANFLMVVGADGNVYLGTESKYNPKFVIGNIKGEWSRSDYYTADRRALVRAMNSENYFPIDGRHRGSLYSQLIDQIVMGKISLDEASKSAETAQIRFPYIL